MEYKDKASCALDILKDGKKIQNSVFYVVEFLLPFIFVLSIIGCIIASLTTSIIFILSGRIFGGILSLIISLPLSIVGVCFTFYFIYLFKAIKDKLVGESSCFIDDKCKEETSKDIKSEDVKNAVKRANKKAEEVKENPKPAKKAPAKPRAKKATTEK